MELATHAAQSQSWETEGLGNHISEFETAAPYGMPVVAVIGNDPRWASEYHIQRVRYGPDRTFETDLLTARYDQVARGFWRRGIRSLQCEIARDAFGIAGDGPACVNVKIESVPGPPLPK